MLLTAAGLLIMISQAAQQIMANRAAAQQLASDKARVADKRKRAKQKRKAIRKEQREIEHRNRLRCLASTRLYLPCDPDSEEENIVLYSIPGKQIVTIE